MKRLIATLFVIAALGVTGSAGAASWAPPIEDGWTWDDR